MSNCWKKTPMPQPGQQLTPIGKPQAVQPIPKPVACPFCGSTDIGTVNKAALMSLQPEHFFAKCHTCGATGPNAVQHAHLLEQKTTLQLSEEAVRLWNDRVATQSPSPTLVGNPWVGLV